MVGTLHQSLERIQFGAGVLPALGRILCQPYPHRGKLGIEVAVKRMRGGCYEAFSPLYCRRESPLAPVELRSQLLDQGRKAGANQRFAAGQPQLVHAQPDEGADQVDDLVVGQVSGHAVGIDELALGGNRDQILARLVLAHAFDERADRVDLELPLVLDPRLEEVGGEDPAVEQVLVVDVEVDAPEDVDPGEVARDHAIGDEEALPYIFDLLQHEGLCLGGSAGINIAGAVRLARELGPGHTIVTILCDYGNRYQSKLFNPVFLKNKGLPVPQWLDI